MHKKGDHGDKAQHRSTPARCWAAALNGHDIGLVSEAGMPAVADPGSSVVRAAHDLGLRVVPLVGPVSLLLALAANGPQQTKLRLCRLPAARRAKAHTAHQRELETWRCARARPSCSSSPVPATRPCPAGPVQNRCSRTPRLALASGLTLPDARVQSQLVRQWKQQPAPPDNRTPVVFALGR